MYIAARSPKLHGIANERGIANHDVEVWSDQTWSFSSLPSFLMETTFFKSEEIISNDRNLDIFIYQPSTVFIVLEPDSTDVFNLHTKGWNNFSGHHNIITSSHTLTDFYMKTFTQTGPKRINLGTPTNEFVGVIFIRGNK